MVLSNSGLLSLTAYCSSVGIFFFFKDIATYRARLVIEFKNCYLKRCENCGLKSVVEKRILLFIKQKKCVWYHSLNNMFQCSKNINMCLVCVCVCFFFFEKLVCVCLI